MLIHQWKDEIISGFRQSAEIMANMPKKVRNKYGADILIQNNGGGGGSGGGGGQRATGHHPRIMSDQLSH